MKARNFDPLEHQEIGIAHLEKDDKRILFAGCGLGKTAMCLDVAARKLLDVSARGFLVVAPLRVANLTWANEVAKWKEFKWLKVANLRTPEGMQALRDGTAHIYTINYESLPKLIRTYLKGKRVKTWAFDHVIWDELSKAKNPKAKRIRQARLYLSKLPGQWGLTGTPTPNTLLDLFAQIRLIDGGQRLGKVFTAYRDRYFYPTDFMRRNWVPHEWARKAINKKIRDLCLTLRSEDWLDIPEVVEEEIEVTLPAAAVKTYNTLKKELLAMLESGYEVEAINAAVLVNKLLQLTSGAVYLEDEVGERFWKPVHDAKIKAAAKFVKEAGEPVLVSCFFKHEQERLAKAIPGSVRFDTAKTSRQQDELLKRWAAGKIRCLIANPASIGHGIDSLQHGGRIVLWVTLTWSRELYDQLNARLARMGQKHQTRIVRLMMPDTIDDAVAEALREKSDEQSSLLDALASFQRLARLRESPTRRTSPSQSPTRPGSRRASKTAGLALAR